MSSRVDRRWTDDLERCPCAAATADGDGRFFHCRLENDTCLYGIFDTHNGTDATHFVLQEIAAELLFDQLSERKSEEEIKEALRNAFLSVEKTYTNYINEIVAERTGLQYELPDDVDKEKLNQKYASILERLTKIDEKLSLGVTSVIALIHKEKLYVANIGDSRALLCKTDDNWVLRVVQLSVDHSLTNADELLRLSKLGLNINKLKEVDMLGNQSSTRCLGNYLVKNLYKAFPDLVNATSEPVISIPEVHGPINIDRSCQFLVLMSDELYKNLQVSKETEQVNKQLAQMIVEEFRVQPSLESVCQAVVTKTDLFYQEHCARLSKTPKKNLRNTLLIRNFNFPLPNAIVTKSPIVQKKSNIPGVSANTPVPHESKVRFNPVVQTRSPLASTEGSDIEIRTNESTESHNMSSIQALNDTNNSNQSGENISSTMMSEFSQGSNFGSSSSYSQECDNRTLNDKKERIIAYVDFTPYYQNVEMARSNGTLPENIQFD